MRTDYSEILNDMFPISLENMDSVRLMNRIDTKYVININRLESLLERIKKDYLVQEINNMRIANYQTIYLDTPTDDMFVAHQNGKADREKVRVREYVDSQLTFLEVKHKNNKGQTNKKRTSINSKESLRTEWNAADFLHSNSEYELKDLLPRIENNFNRVTLVNKGKTERLTLDYNINFLNLETGQTETLPEIAIVEIKQEGNSYSPIKEIFQGERIRSVSISKYCLGSVLTNSSLKYNRFKKKLMQINKITNNHYGYIL